jgi:hypothetical protein
MQKILLAVVLMLVSTQALSDVPKDQSKEIAHLLKFVKTSSCIVNRNGSEHDGAGAAKHMTKKYKHFEDDIESSEDFIRLSATKSTMSGKMYKVKCPGKSGTTTKEWLLGELKVFRQGS